MEIIERVHKNEENITFPYRIPINKCTINKCTRNEENRKSPSNNIVIITAGKIHQLLLKLVGKGLRETGYCITSKHHLPLKYSGETWQLTPSPEDNG